MAGFAKRLFNYAVTYIASCVCVNIYGHTCTSNQIVNYVSHLASIKNVLSDFMTLVMGAIIVMNQVRSIAS